MSSTPEQKFIEQLKTVIAAADNLMKRSQFDDLSDLPEADVNLGLSRLRAVVERASVFASSYARDLNRIDATGWKGGEGLAMYRGVAQSLLDDMEAGYTRSIQEIIHDEVFSDYFEMAEHLLESGYKDAAAVIAGSTLEGHLRNLCRRYGVAVDRPTETGTAAKKADALNAELSSAGAYGKLDQKNVTAWLDLRNKAAHGHYADYTKEQVTLLVSSVRDFATRLPA
jgi:hypothetical protein